MAGPLREQPLAAQYRALRERRKAGRPVDFEALLRDFYRGFLKPGDVALDLGAFKATHAMPLAEAVRGPGGAVHAAEPNPALAALLRRRFAHPDLAHVTLHEMALGLADGAAEFVLALDSPGYSGLREREYDQPDMRTRRIPVRMARLDTVFARMDRLAFIKADLEGGEFDAFRGGEALIARTRPAMGFEFGHRAYGAYGVDPGAVFDWFARLDYVLFDILGNRLGQRERFLQSDRLPGMFEYLAIPRERRDLAALAQGQSASLPDWNDAPSPGLGPTRHLFVPGLAKAGTTFLFDQLAAQPALFGRAREKEIGYFSRPQEPRRADYLGHFPVAARQGRILLDASPAYIQSRADAARRIRATLPTDAVQIAILLRDPIDALFSHYLHDLKSTIGRPSWMAQRPAHYALDEPAVLERYLRPRAAAVAGFREVFGSACRGFHMAGLFDGTVAAALGEMLGVTLAPFTVERIANRGGFVPRYVLGGSAGAAWEQDGKVWHVPPGALLFAAEERSELHHDIPAEEAAALVRLGESFTTGLTLPTEALRPVVEDYLAMCATLDLAPALKPRGDTIHFSAALAGVSPAVLARLQPGSGGSSAFGQ